MSPAAVETFSTVGVGVLCVALGIMSLAIFFRILASVGESGSRPDTMAVRGILKKDTWATVYTTSEEFERVRFLGFTNTDSLKTHLPHELNGMVILEDPQRTKHLIRAKAIRMITVAPEQENAG